MLPDAFLVLTWVALRASLNHLTISLSHTDTPRRPRVPFGDPLVAKRKAGDGRGDGISVPHLIITTYDKRPTLPSPP